MAPHQAGTAGKWVSLVTFLSPLSTSKYFKKKTMF